MNRIDLRELLTHIDPAMCSYEEWAEVGMVLKHENYSVSDWDEWSRRDPARYHAGECERKWNSFRGNASPVTGGTIYQMALNNGWQPNTGYELDWDSTIDQDGLVIDTRWIEDKEVSEPASWHPAQQLIEYLSILFEAGENVGFVTKSWKNEKGKYIPKDKGVYNKTAGQLIEALSKCGDDIGSVLGDYDKDGGAWIRFNPLDGNGVRNENVTEFRYALVESDNMEIERQNALIHELELPVAVLVHSGGKSLHAIVRIEAADYTEYRKRVNYLYDICEANGMQIDKQNRNPSRLSRMPGCVRGDGKQFIVETNIGKGSWEDWKEHIESSNDSLPEFESLSDTWDNMPPLAPELIKGLLREGHKMLISGPSKAGKSYLLIELTIALAEGRKWLQWDCQSGPVLYVNLELDENSCRHRFKDVYKAMGIKPAHINNIDLWNLRGKSMKMTELTPKLIRRAKKKNYKSIIIDPIYKVITGDENSADQMAAFCNQFDRVATELSCAVIYCHHHSKGAQGGKKAIDRASGSGVFARDPDAVLDMIELPLTEEITEQQVNKGLCAVMDEYMKARKFDLDEFPEDMRLNSKQYRDFCQNKLDEWQWNALTKKLETEQAACASMTGWRIEGTLREFAAFDPLNLWFRWPVHLMDLSETLKNINPEAEATGWQQMIERRKESCKKETDTLLSRIEIAFSGQEKDGRALLTDIADEIEEDYNKMKEWFGYGNRRKPKLCKTFKKVIEGKGRAAKVYLVRKENSEKEEGETDEEDE